LYLNFLIEGFQREHDFSFMKNKIYTGGFQREPGFPFMKN